jgi:hypothetical protein
VNNKEKSAWLGPLIGPESEQKNNGPMMLRPAVATAHHPSTIMLPGDLPASAAHWLKPANGRITKENKVKYLIRGEETYAAMRRAIETAKKPGEHFILLAGWSVTLDFPLSANGAAPTMAELLTKKSKEDEVQIRGIYWRQADEMVNAMKKHGRMGGLMALVAPSTLIPNVATFIAMAALDRLGVTSRSILGAEGQNFKEVAFINDLPTGVAVLDKHHTAVGCHHQKIMIVHGTEGLIAFVGGIDVYPDRIWPAGSHGCTSAGAPYEDEHCEIRGEAAFDVLDVYIDRWAKCGVPITASLPLDWTRQATMAQVSPSAPRCAVQIGHTNGNHTIPGPPQTAKAMILNAIGAAQRYIYVEDQYLVNMEAAKALNAAVPRIKALTILIPHWSISDLPQCTYRRRRFIEQVLHGLTDEDRRKVGVYCLNPPGGRFTYVHSKFWIFDDECAIIGSANCNRRGWESDSEIVAGVVNTVHPLNLDISFAHQLRMDVWARHLRVQRWQVHDPIASVAYWRRDPVFHNAAPYDHHEFGPYDLDNPTVFTVWRALLGPALDPHALYDVLWDNAFDPGRKVP